MNVWHAQTSSRGWRNGGGRFYVMENSGPSRVRPPYAVGDEIRVGLGMEQVVVGEITAVGRIGFDAKVDDVDLRFTPTPAHLPSSYDDGGMESQDMVADLI